MSPLINLTEHGLGAPTAGELAGLLAHDLRTPLNAVRGFSELLLAGSAGPMTREMIGLLREISRAGRALEAAVACAQELGEPCIGAGECTRCGLRAVLADAGFAISFRDVPDTAEVVGEATGWRRLLDVCRDHLGYGFTCQAISAEVRAAGARHLHLELSSDREGVAGPASVLRERCMRRLAASQHTELVSELPHRPVRLLARCDPTGR